MNRLARLFSLAALRRHALLLALLLTAPLFADTSGNFTYAVSNGKATITDFPTSYSGALTIPSSIGGYPVTSIGYCAFQNCRSLTSVVIPASVTSIGEGAFWGCSALTSVTIPEGMTAIGRSAFWYCSSLTSVEIPARVTSIGNNAFQGCSSLTSVTILSSVTSIGSGAFFGVAPKTLIAAAVPSGLEKRNLTSVVILEGVTSIVDYEFSSCSSLTSVAIPSSVTSIGNYAFADCSALTSVEIPARVTSIGNNAFEDCSALTSVTIPEGVTSIGWYAFFCCSSLASVVIPEGVTSIGNEAFSRCSSLTSVTFLGEPCVVGEYTFPGKVTGFYPSQYAAAWEAVIAADGTWRNLKMKEAKPTVTGDEGATIEGSAEAGWTVKPSGGVKDVVISIPEGVEAAKVTVEVPSTATSVTANGATIKVIKVEGEKRYDITAFLNIPAAVAGKIDLTQAEVKTEIAKAILDTSEAGGAVFNPAAEPPLKTAPTKPGLTYILLVGDSLDSLKEVDRKVGDGQPWQPQVKKQGPSAFYCIRVSK